MSKQLTLEQVCVVKEAIIDSMRGVWVDNGSMPPDSFIKAATTVADRIIKNVQSGLSEKASIIKIIGVKKAKKYARK